MSLFYHSTYFRTCFTNEAYNSIENNVDDSIFIFSKSTKYCKIHNTTIVIMSEYYSQDYLQSDDSADEDASEELPVFCGLISIVALLILAICCAQREAASLKEKMMTSITKGVSVLQYSCGMNNYESYSLLSNM